MNEMAIQYEMTPRQHEDIRVACEPRQMLSPGGVISLFWKQTAGNAWAILAMDLGFDVNTVEAIPGKSDYFFMAVTLTAEGEA